MNWNNTKEERLKLLVFALLPSNKKIEGKFQGNVKKLANHFLNCSWIFFFLNNTYGKMEEHNEKTKCNIFRLVGCGEEEKVSFSPKHEEHPSFSIIEWQRCFSSYFILFPYCATKNSSNLNEKKSLRKLK